jgi:g-D-glutamyl-meso-diaminopimelate peptidase
MDRNHLQTGIVKPAASYGYPQMIGELHRLAEIYPFLELERAGTSVMGKPIMALRIGTGGKQVHYNGAVHANEWITTILLMRLIEEYAAALRSGAQLRGRDVMALYAETTLRVIPMANPDGVELVQEPLEPGHPYYRELMEWNGGSGDFSAWKANIRGVDLNDQFPAHWEEERARRAVTGPGPRDYSGIAPLTEPEAVALYDYTRKHRFRLVLSLHTQGEEIYWNYRGLEPEESAGMAGRLARASGYKPVRLSDSDAGYKDWFIQEFRRPGFTVEAGRGVNPLPIADFPRIYGALACLLLEGLAL